MIFILSFFLSFAWAKTVIQQVEILDGTGAPKSAPLDVEITGDLITRIAPHIKSAGARVIDGRGHVLIPGLIDAHTHLPSIPGRPFLDLSPEQIRTRQKEQLRAYLANGVTTVLDCAAPEALLRDAQALEREAPGPRILALAPFLTPKNGYFAEENMRGDLFRDLWPSISKPEDVAREFEAAAKYKPFGAKVTMETGYGPFSPWPAFSEPLRAKIVAEALQHHSPLLVHSMTKKEHRMALSLHPYALVHAGFMDEDPDAEILKEMKNSGAYVVTTAALEKIIGLMWHPEIAQDPWYRMMVPADELANAADRKIRGRVIGGVATATGPSWAPGFITRMFAPSFFNEKEVSEMDARSKKSILTMYKAGLPLVMGSDSGNWPLWTIFFHGVSSVLEMETLMEAGIPPNEVLAMATSRAAQMLKLEGQVGRVKEGFFADLVLLKKDPLTDPSAYRSPELIFKGGVAKTPAEWLGEKRKAGG